MYVASHPMSCHVTYVTTNAYAFSSPKRDGSHDSRSDESWQSPVLGESVSMIAESMGQESTKQQLDVIIVSLFILYYVLLVITMEYRIPCYE